jgi:hypothetical protein
MFHFLSRLTDGYGDVKKNENKREEEKNGERMKTKRQKEESRRKL